MPVKAEGALQTSEARAFLAGLDDDVFFFLAVGVAASVLAVLLAAGFAAVALPAVGSEAEFDEVFAVAVWAGQGDRDGHEVIL